MNRLTKQEQMVLCVVMGLLLSGWAVKAYRTAHPSIISEHHESAARTTEVSQNTAPSSEANQ